MKLLIKGALAALLLTGAATSASAQATATASAQGSVTIFRPITVTKNVDLKFGNIVKPGAGTGSAAVAGDSGGALTVGGGVVDLASGDPSSAAKFTIAGEGGQIFTLAVDDSFDITNGTDTISVTTDQDTPDGDVTLSGALGDAGDGTKIVYVGGSIPVAFDVSTGLFVGNFNVTATYN
ncbi:DUF4402 domain-containing protein [Phenylobacterium sp.]|uniref:DUF4402 domain-containing protein n=1 Tax=Phenylobacterium sp. TaxID=1871053 RepID=UPI002737D261|nr:DUF4402 domain-containing protein [Phenylobacterium sp.]MDP3869338.1 DUF4402 domain-containing protein [Phenylobacterium sp.]